LARAELPGIALSNATGRGCRNSTGLPPCQGGIGLPWSSGVGAGACARAGDVRLHSPQAMQTAARTTGPVAEHGRAEG
jgi:hypothetical protein